MCGIDNSKKVERKHLEFKTDIFSLDKPNSINFTIPGAKLPSAKDVYFRAKQKELVE